MKREMWFVKRDMWHVACGMCRVLCGMWRVTCDMCCAVLGVWCVSCGGWRVVCVVRCMECGVGCSVSVCVCVCVASAVKTRVSEGMRKHCSSRFTAYCVLSGIRVSFKKGVNAKRYPRKTTSYHVSMYSAEDEFRIRFLSSNKFFTNVTLKLRQSPFLACFDLQEQCLFLCLQIDSHLGSKSRLK